MGAAAQSAEIPQQRHVGFFPIRECTRDCGDACRFLPGFNAHEQREKMERSGGGNGRTGERVQCAAQKGQCGYRLAGCKLVERD
jgi:hypothetical protein